MEFFFHTTHFDDSETIKTKKNRKENITDTHFSVL